MKQETIGFTTTIPVEILLAANVKPVDLNNIFISSPDAAALVDEAEQAGFPQNVCSWHKGIFAVVRRLKIKKIIAVMQGDCSSSQAMAELLEAQGIEVIPFAYPYNRDKAFLKAELARLARYFKTTLTAAEKVKRQLDKIRVQVQEIDEFTWRWGKVTGRENHYWSVSCSDFNGNALLFGKGVTKFLGETRNRQSLSQSLRLGYVGVPPICPQLYDFLEQNNARVVFNEVQRQFSMPYQTKSLVEQYLRYTYPYNIFNRLNDIEHEIKTRRIQGIIHYVQNFCHRQIHDRILRQALKLPVLTLEFDRPGKIDGRTANRIQAFLEMIEP